MSRFKELIREIHRRSIWQVVGIYLVGGWVALQIVDTLTGALMLPDWFPPFALVLLIIGFPIVLATAFVQDRLGPTEDGTEPADGLVGASPGEPTGQEPVTFPPERGTGTMELVAMSGLDQLFTWPKAIGGGVLAFACWGLIAAGWVLLAGRPPGVSTAGLASPVGSVLLPQGDVRDKSIAVLPLENLSADPENSFFADGFHDILVARLSKIADLRVIARNSVVRYRDSNLTPRQIAEELAVGALMTGSVQRAGDRVQVVTRLMDPDTESQLWAETYERGLEDVFAIQGEIAERVVTSLSAVMTLEEQNRVTARPTGDASALDLYMRGRSAYYRFTPDDNEQALSLFRQATEADPSFADAWAGLGDTYLQRVQFFGWPIEWADSGRVAAERALQLDSGSSHGWKTLGFAAFLTGNGDEMRDALLRAIELDPSSADAANNMGVRQALSGDLVGALSWYKRSFQLAPNTGLARANVGAAYLYLGETDIAGRWLEEALLADSNDLVGRYWSTWTPLFAGDPAGSAARARENATREGPPLFVAQAAAAALLARDFEEAHELAEQFRRTASGSNPFSFIGHHVTSGTALARLGRMSEARPHLDRALQAARGTPGMSPEKQARISAVRAVLLEDGEALDALHQAIDEGFLFAPFIEHHPAYDNLRDNERFQRILSGVREEVERQRLEVEREERAAGLR